MMRSLWISKTGMEAQQTQLDNISNNLANVSTDGFKSQRVFATLLNGLEPAADATTDLTTGNLKQTGNALDVAFKGEGFLVVSTPNGERFTRSSLGATTAISSLVVEAGTNGLRRVELRGYQSDPNQVLSTVTEAAVRGAVAGAK